MAKFIQIVEFQSSRIDEIRALGEDMRSQRDAGTVRGGSITADRDRPGHYRTIIEFDSYDEAMQNSARPETTEFASQMAKLCDGPPTFANLDVLDSWQAT